jgi:hypothetical protein
MIDKILIEREGEIWKITILDKKGKEHKIPQKYPTWKLAVNHMPYVTLTDRGYKVTPPDSAFVVD